MPEPLEPTEPWAAAEAAAMAQPEFALMAGATAMVLQRLTRLWVTLWGSIQVIPSSAEGAESIRSSAGRGSAPSSAFGGVVLGGANSQRTPRFAQTGSSIDFPQVWIDAVDDGLADVINAMDAAADSVHREVPAADVEQAKTYRRERVRRAITSSEVAKRGFLAVSEAIAQPEKLTSDVRGVVVGQLVADHTEQQLERATELGDEWVCVWVPERDACVRCLAYAGLHVTPANGQLFPGGRTWGPRWKSVISRPDFRGPGWRELPDGSHAGSHPHCRCELRIFKRANVAAIVTALQREATRSAAKGWARPTEGGTVRTAAAQHALNSAIPLPRSVEDETRRRLRNPAAFPRRVPSPTR